MLYRTSALSADTDGDGQSDAAEIAAGTDPDDGRSVMTVLAFSRAGSGVALRWTSVRGKSYRVLRSSGPGFASYTVLGSGLVAAGTQTEYVDPTVLTALVPAMFYRVEVEDAPPAPEVDSDRDGVPDAQEIAAGSDPGRYDTDRDGLGDGEEMLVLLTSPIRTDTDGDGSSDWAELVAGTSPTNPASVLAITGIARNADGSVTLRWSGVAGRTYRVLRSATPGFDSFDVIATGWPGFPPSDNVHRRDNWRATDGVLSRGRRVISDARPRAAPKTNRLFLERKWTLPSPSRALLSAPLSPVIGWPRWPAR
jgi:hypothetical protein